MLDLGIIEFTRKNGSEEFVGSSEGHSLLNYWQWAYSDLVGNTERGVLAEFIVALACGIRWLQLAKCFWQQCKHYPEIYVLTSFSYCGLNVKSFVSYHIALKKTHSFALKN